MQALGQQSGQNQPALHHRKHSYSQHIPPASILTGIFMGTLEPRKDTFRRFSLKAKTHTRLEVQAMFQQSSTNVYHKKRKRKCLKTTQPELSVRCSVIKVVS